jgi:hypothetical protein
MSTVVEEVEEVKKVQSSNGVVTEHRAPPMFPFVAAPIVAVTASIIATRLIRRRQPRGATNPTVYWTLASGNRIEFRPTLAPRFGSLLVRGGRARARRRLFRR